MSKVWSELTLPVSVSPSLSLALSREQPDGRLFKFAEREIVRYRLKLRLSTGAPVLRPCNY